MNKELYMNGVGDTYYRRRSQKDAIRQDRVTSAIERLGISPKVVLEIGCGDGFRLARLKEKYDCAVFGIEPSIEALRNVHIGVNAVFGDASDLPYEISNFDVVIYGFCLYCCDRTDLFRIAMEGDRVLKTGGYIVVLDFYRDAPEFRHSPDSLDVITMKMDYGNMWLWHPAYELVHKDIYVDSNSGDEAVQVLCKKGCQ